MRWIKEHKLISILVIVLMVLLVLFALSTKSEIGSSIVSSGFNTVVQKIQGGFTKGGESVKNGFRGIFKYKELQEENAKLKEENDKLQKELTENMLNSFELNELRDLSDLLNYEYIETDFDIISCNLVSKDNTLYTKTFNISLGTESGISVNDPVVNGMGLVGKIQETGKGYSKVLCIIDSDIKVSFRVVRDNSIEGIVSGDGKGELEGYTMNPDATIVEGDVIITSGLGIYPEGIVIGTVRNINYNENTLMKEVQIEPSVDFEYINKVSVIRWRFGNPGYYF